MRPVVVLALLQFEPRYESGAAHYYQEIDKKLQVVEGYLGVGLWRSMRTPGEFISLYHYSSGDAAERAYGLIGNSRVQVISRSAPITPADVSRIEIFSKLGRDEPNAKVGDFLSVSDRVADPGFGPELIEEVTQTLQNLTLLPGFLGAECGRSEALPDRVFGIASWESEAAYRGSIPPGRIPDVDLYRRVL
jgi:heme-degrading monooxygenase HmoA